MNKSEIQSRLLEMTGENDIEKAFDTLEQMVQTMGQLQNVGMVCMLVGPKGVLQVLLSDRFMKDIESTSVLQNGLLDLQSSLLNYSRQVSRTGKNQKDED